MILKIKKHRQVMVEILGQSRDWTLKNHLLPARVDLPYFDVGVPDPVDFGDLESFSFLEDVCFIDFSMCILFTELQTGEFSSPTSQLSS